MNFNCENCGWSETDGSPIMCNYSGHRTWRDECCEAWKPKEKETNMVEVVRCKDCQFHYSGENVVDAWNRCRLHSINTEDENYCSWGVMRNDD